MLYRLGVLMARHRWAVVGIWLAALALGVPFAPRALTVLRSGFGDVDTESRRGLTMMQERLGIPESSLTLVFRSQEMAATDPAFIREMEAAMAALSASPEVVDVITHYRGGSPHMVSPDGRVAYAIVRLAPTIEEAIDLYPALRARLKTESLELLVTGGIPIFADVNSYSERDLRRGEALAFPLVLVGLVLAFRGVVAAALPLAVGGIAVALTLALVYAVGQVTEMSIFSLNIATFLGLGIAVDYSLLVVSRFREELAARGVADAVGVTVATAGRALLFSALTTLLGLSGLLLFRFMMLRSVGVAGMLVVALSLLLALTLLPALLGILGPRVNALAFARRQPGGGGAWRRIATWVMGRPLAVIVPVTVFLVALGTPFLGVEIGAPWASILPRESEARRGWELLEERFGPGEASPVVVLAVADGPFLGSPEAIGSLYDLAQRLLAEPGVGRVDSIVTLDPSISKEGYVALLGGGTPPPPEVTEALGSMVAGDTAMLRLFETAAPLSPESRALVRRARGVGAGSSLSVLVTGATADVMDSVEVMYRDFPWIVGYVLGAIVVALFLLFRSVVLPLKAVLMNVMSIFASYGALVYIFQQGHLEGLLGFTSPGYTESTVPILMFCILFGLSMDYEVFLLTRIKERYDTTGDNAASVVHGLERTGGVITSAAFILVAVLAAFATGEVVVVKALGVGMGIAIAVDVTVVRVLLVPALMRVLGRWNWWAPRFLGGRPAPGGA